MVRNVVEMMHETLARSKECERINKPKYKLIPRKIQEGNGKVYILLTKPLDNTARIRVALEANGAREIPVKRRNPYTLTFVIPDDLIHIQNMVNVHVWNGEDFMGVSSVKCVSKMGELYGLLSSVTSPYEFLRSTLGVSALSEVDNQLTAAFRKNLPLEGFSLLRPENKLDKYSTKEEFPSLLHFAARYGLYSLTHELFKCPGSHTAANMKNSKGLTPAQLANNEGHIKVAAAIDDFLKMNYLQEKENIATPTTCLTCVPDTAFKKGNPLDDYDIPAQPVPVLHLPTNRMVGRTTNDRECDYMQMKASMKENIEPLQNIGLGLNEKRDNVITNTACNAERAKLSLLESQAKLIEIMEAYKKGASLTDVEKMHNEWKTRYQVSDMEAKSTLDGLRSLYAKAQKAKMLKKHSTSFSELRQFLNSKWRRKDSDSKSMSRRNSKDSNSSEKVSPESETVRPVSTLSVLSNTSSSSGSSFDRLSTASAGSDSGHHSDFGDDRNNRFRERCESRYQHQQRKASTDLANSLNNHKTLTLNTKPPAPPPRPVKTTHYGSLENCKQSEIPHYSTTKKLIAPSFEEALKMLDFVPPSSKSSSLKSDFRSGRKTSLSSIDFSSFEDPCENYDRPPPPRPSCSTAVSPTNDISLKLSFPIGPKTDYDIVPPPLPISPPPIKQDNNCDADQSYDIPPPFLQRSNSISSDYDFPKASIFNNTDNQPACTCHMAARINNLSSVKSCCVGNKLSSLKQVGTLPSVPSFDVIDREKTNNNINKSRPVQRHQYSNVVCLKPPKDSISDRDSIPEEMAPPPPVIFDEGPEEHYKIVGAPTPVPSMFKVS
nr:uncharacterized protein LOC107451770 isoform X2 [Parasteatoda tepidariorum]XP_042904507.1 uncharacterized protein LOC107451770 isoform X2 [Parasteatoda tepidariorum]